MATRPLTAKQAAFVMEYLVDLNATQAAIRAGYSAKTAETCGPRMLRFARVREFIDAAKAKRAARVEVTAEYVLSVVTETINRCRQCEPVLNRDGEPTGEWRFDANAVLKGSELLARHLGMLRDRVSLENPDGTALIQGDTLTTMAALLATGAGTVATERAQA